MSAEEFYALLKAQIDVISAQTIRAAAEAYFQEHPDFFIEQLGLYKDSDGYICQQ